MPSPRRQIAALCFQTACIVPNDQRYRWRQSADSVVGASVHARASSAYTTRQPARPIAIVMSVSSASVAAGIEPIASSACRRNAPIAPGTVGMQSSTS